MVAGTMAWNGVSNNRAFISGEIGLTQNGVSVYYAPETALTLCAMVPKYTRVPNAAKEYIRFMMEAEQYDPWLTGCLGYWSQPLKAYADSAVWSSDPKIAVFRSAMDTPYYEGFRGPIGAAMGAVHENWIVVDMFARVV